MTIINIVKSTYNKIYKTMQCNTYTIHLHITKHKWPVNSTVVSKLKDFFRSQAEQVCLNKILQFLTGDVS